MTTLNHLEHYAWFSLGGNLGDVRLSLERARSALSEMALGTMLCSNLYESEPWGRLNQPAFVNQVIGIQPKETINGALAMIHAFESAEGRKRTVVWGPRKIDIDILLWPNQIRNDPDLVVPHPRLHERRFVLEPWAEVAPNLRVPIMERTVQELLNECPDTGWVKAL